MNKVSCPDVDRTPVKKSTVDPASAWTNRRATEQAARAARARQMSGRRRFVDPTTSERDYTEAEMEFMLAMNEYKHQSGRMFPTWSEVLEVLRTLGYEKVDAVGGEEGELKERAKASAPAGR
jgi:hypothetical protein